MTWLIVSPESGIETASSGGIWKGKLMIPFHSSFPLGSIWIGELSSFPFPMQFPSPVCPQGWRGCRSPMFPPDYLFYNFFSWPPWLFVLDQSCSKGLCSCHCVPGFPASPSVMCCGVRHCKRQCSCRCQWLSSREDHFRIIKKLGKATAENYSRAWQDESSLVGHVS